MFKGDGTWFIPWSAVSDAAGTGAAMPAGTKIRSASIGMVLTKTDWYAGYGVSIGQVGTVKVNAPGDAAAEVLVNPADLTLLPIRMIRLRMSILRISETEKLFTCAAHVCRTAAAE